MDLTEMAACLVNPSLLLMKKKSTVSQLNPRCEEDAEKYAFPFHTGTNVSEASKAVLAYEKAEEILRRSLTLIGQSCLHLVQIHHAQRVRWMVVWIKNLNLREILWKLKESMQSDVRQAAVWNTLGLILLKTGTFAISVLSSLLAVAHTNYDCLANLEIAYLQSGYLAIFSGYLELSKNCFQELILKDQNHPTALINYAALLLCRYGCCRVLLYHHNALVKEPASL
ncbi:putative tetratricopeptide-like helical domain-containing protein [Rosa chinensis]|uniref:Putative tetratricopeptide-like helical domain-containing protein n=1 Tax=Rosa chinensis TaxID=74649 RepID=A0A2P6Q959_ROSCH|nr:putative tetratricopeptide-like helical domain-containing protein [Rosa chinensis]